MPSPAGASFEVGAGLEATRSSGIPSCPKTQRQESCISGRCDHHTLLPLSWKLCSLPFPHGPVEGIGATSHSSKTPALFWNSTRSTRSPYDQRAYVKPDNIVVGRKLR